MHKIVSKRNPGNSLARLNDVVMTKALKSPHSPGYNNILNLVNRWDGGSGREKSRLMMVTSHMHLRFDAYSNELGAYIFRARIVYILHNIYVYTPSIHLRMGVAMYT